MVTPDDITTALKDIGLRKGQTVMVHTSLSSLGYVCGGAQSVIEAFKADFLPLPQERTKPQKHFVFAALWRFWNSFLLFFYSIWISLPNQLFGHSNQIVSIHINIHSKQMVGLSVCIPGNTVKNFFFACFQSVDDRFIIVNI